MLATSWKMPFGHRLKNPLLAPLEKSASIPISDVPVSFFSSQSHKLFESESWKFFSSWVMTCSSRVRV